MNYLHDYVPALKYGAKITASEIIAGSIEAFASTGAAVYYVDGDNGVDTGDGLTPDTAKATIQAAVTAAAARNTANKTGSIVYIKAKKMAAASTDPSSYAENVTIPAAGGDRMMLIGVSANRTQGGLPQIKPGGTVASSVIDVRASGCLIANLGINGNSTAGAALNVGVKINSDGATGTYSAYGTSILNCHFKNCTGSTTTDCRTGGAITWSVNGDGWQTLIKGNRFYKNACDVCLLGTSNSVPQDVIIEDNVFSGPTASVDTQLWLAGGSGINGLCIRHNTFPVLGTLSSAVVKRFIDATGCVGELVDNAFGSATGTSTGFGAAKALAKIPTTVFMVNNYTEAGLITREA